ncbi:hypothetical protein ACVW1C_004423 [Bradyrhizobium sp. USDA 4011]
MPVLIFRKNVVQEQMSYLWRIANASRAISDPDHNVHEPRTYRDAQLTRSANRAGRELLFAVRFPVCG